MSSKNKTKTKGLVEKEQRSAEEKKGLVVIAEQGGKVCCVYVCLGWGLVLRGVNRLKLSFCLLKPVRRPLPSVER